MSHLIHPYCDVPRFLTYLHYVPPVTLRRTTDTVTNDKVSNLHTETREVFYFKLIRQSLLSRVWSFPYHLKVHPEK